VDDDQCISHFATFSKNHFYTELKKLRNNRGIPALRYFERW